LPLHISFIANIARKRPELNRDKTSDATQDLVPCFRHDELQHTLWLVASKESYTRPAVRKFMAFAGEHFKAGIQVET
jgi:hypothetical protein